MTKKKITVGLSSQNGQNYLLERYKIARKENDEQTMQDIDFLLDSVDIYEEEIYFKKPITPKNVLGVSQETWRAFLEEEQRERDENIEKLQLLCDHYGITEDRFKYLNLSIALARELYPEPKKRGRANKWSDELLGILIVEMENLITSNADASNKGATWAAAQLAKNQDWQDFIEKKESENTTPNPAEVIRSAYHKYHNTIKSELKLRLKNYTTENLQMYKAILMKKKT